MKTDIRAFSLPELLVVLVIRSIRYYSTKTVIKLRVGSYNLDNLVRKSRWALSIDGLRY